MPDTRSYALPGATMTMVVGGSGPGSGGSHSMPRTPVKAERPRMRLSLLQIGFLAALGLFGMGLMAVLLDLVTGIIPIAWARGGYLQVFALTCAMLGGVIGFVVGMWAVWREMRSDHL